jgi:hypothetical protein
MSQDATLYGRALELVTCAEGLLDMSEPGVGEDSETEGRQHLLPNAAGMGLAGSGGGHLQRAIDSTLL